MIHDLNIQSRYFNYIKNGTKRIELRLYDEKRSKINIGDTLNIINNDNSNDKFNAKVVGLLRYSTFEDLFKDFDIEMLADKSMTKPELINVLNKFYTNELQNKFGVIGIRIELI